MVQSGGIQPVAGMPLKLVEAVGADEAQGRVDVLRRGRRGRHLRLPARTVAGVALPFQPQRPRLLLSLTNPASGIGYRLAEGRGSFDNGRRRPPPPRARCSGTIARPARPAAFDLHRCRPAAARRPFRLPGRRHGLDGRTSASCCPAVTFIVSLRSKSTGRRSPPAWWGGTISRAGPGPARTAFCLSSGVLVLLGGQGTCRERAPPSVCWVGLASNLGHAGRTHRPRHAPQHCAADRLPPLWVVSLFARHRVLDDAGALPTPSRVEQSSPGGRASER